MSDRKHVTIRFFQVPLQFDADEQAYGTTLLALPANTEVTVLDVNPLGQAFTANVSLVSSQDVSDEELAQIEASIEEAQQTGAEQAPAEEPQGSIIVPEGSNVTTLPNREARRKNGQRGKRPTPPVSG